LLAGVGSIFIAGVLAPTLILRFSAKNPIKRYTPRVILCMILAAIVWVLLFVGGYLAAFAFFRIAWGPSKSF